MRRKKYPPQNPVVNQESPSVSLGGEPSSSATKPGRFFGSPWDKKGGIKDPSAGPDWGLDELVATFRAGETVHPEYAVPISFRETIEKVRAGGEEGKKAKSTLPYVCVSGTFKKRSKRSLIAHSGLLQGDLDPDDRSKWTEEDQRKLMDALDRECDYARSLAKGPSGCGAKLIFFRPDLVGLTGDEALAGHDEFFRAVEAYMNGTFGEQFGVTFDKQCSDVSRAFYATWDPDLIDRREKAKPIDAEFITKWIATPITPTQAPEPRRDAAAVAVHDSAPHRPAPRTTGAGGDESPFKALEALPDTPSRVISLLCQHGLEPDGRDGSGQDAGASLKRPASMSSTGDTAEGSGSVKVYDGSGWALFRSAGAGDYFADKVASSSVMTNSDGHTIISPGGLILALEFGGDWSAFLSDLERRTGRTFGKAPGAEWYGKERPAAGEPQPPERSPTEDTVDRKVVVAYLHNLDLLDLHPLDDPGFLRVADLRVVYEYLLHRRQQGADSVNAEVFIEVVLADERVKQLDQKTLRGWFNEPPVGESEVEELIDHLRQEFRTRKAEEIKGRIGETVGKGDLAAVRQLTDELESLQAGTAKRLPFIDVSSLDADEAPAPDVGPVLIGGHCIWRSASINEVHGEPGGGKTMVLMATVIAELNRGNRVLLIDPEDDSLGTNLKRRLRRMGVEENGLVDRLFVVTESDDQMLRDLTLFAAEKGVTAVVIDGFSTMLQDRGIEENDNTAVGNFLRTYLEPFARKAGAAVIYSDHVTKSDDKHSRGYARGAGSKKALISGLSWHLKNLAPFDYDQKGRARMTLAKNRQGGLRVDGKKGLLFELDGGPPSAGGKDLWEFQEAGNYQFRGLQAKIVAVFQRLETEEKGGWLSQRKIEEKLKEQNHGEGVRRGNSAEALGQLVELGILEPRDGMYNSTEYQLIAKNGSSGDLSKTLDGAEG